ncbi:MAG: Glu/Leu/Phe/Val dehydrogenase, partial [Candidatus Marinimicrobia bacterium]|nr:Glu/Leu/Phe/Val dehydrogenase [Candidatus Neomarinimicrobiota bacterium]
AVVTGKPLSLGGSLGREDATGKGVVIVTGQWAQDNGLSLEGATVVVQGFGNVGSFAAFHFMDKGAKVIAVNDINGAIRNDKGLDIKALMQHVAKTGTVAGFELADELNSDEILLQKCDYLVPAALGGVITAENAGQIDAKVVVEAANHPVTPEGEDILLKAGTEIIPDLIANAGGVTVSYFEWVQNIQQFAWNAERVSEELHRILGGGFAQVLEFSKKHKVTLRQASFGLALKRVYEASKARGYIRI